MLNTVIGAVRIAVVLGLSLLTSAWTTAHATDGLSVHIAVRQASCKSEAYQHTGGIWVQTKVSNNGTRSRAITEWSQAGWSWVSDNPAVTPDISAAQNFPITVRLTPGWAYRSRVLVHCDQRSRRPLRFRLGFVPRARRPASGIPGIRKTRDIIWSNPVTLRRAALARCLTNRLGAENSESQKAATIPSIAQLPSSRRLIHPPIGRVPTEPALRIRLDGDANLAVLVTDPKGQRSGIELGSHTALQDIPHSQVRRVLAKSGTHKQRQTVIITIVPAQSTTYGLAIVGRQAGQYALVVQGVSPALNLVTEPFTDERVPADTVVHYHVNLKNIPVMRPWLGMSAHPAPPAAKQFISVSGKSALPLTDPSLVAAAAAIDRAPCDYFFRRLAKVFHQSITRSQGELTWYPDGRQFSGCQVVLRVADDTPAGGPKLPDFDLPEGSYLYRLGWRQSTTWGADGPGFSGNSFADHSWLCIAASRWPEGRTKKNGHLVPSSALTLTVQCRKRALRTR